MSHGESVGRPPEDLAADGYRAEGYRAERVRAAWPSVHIDFVEAAQTAMGCRVGAVVHLDGISPADAVVTVAPAADVAAGHTRAELRMWSAESYDNGCYLFERLIPPTATGCVPAGDWVVVVRPSGAAVGRPVMYPLRITDWGSGHG